MPGRVEDEFRLITKDVADTVLFLVSDESKYVTGIELTIDGGALCHQALPELDFEEMKAAGPLHQPIEA